MDIKKFQLFLLCKISRRPTWPAQSCPPKWRIEGVLMTSFRILSSRFIDITWYTIQDLPFFFTFTEINVANDRFKQQMITKFEGTFTPLWTVENLPKTVSLISPVLPRLRSCHLPWTKLVHRWVDSVNKIMGEI